MKLATMCIHAGQPPDPATGATIVPIYQTSTYTQDAIGRHKGYEYSRTGNPTRTALESALAAVENGAHGLAFASGSAATSAVLHLLRPGERVVAADDLYGGTIRLFETVFRPMGVAFDYIDAADTGRLREALERPARLVWLETPTNPLLRVADLRAAVAAARAAGALLAVDNTFATPALQRPLELGADIVVHSTTKYIAGHSDVIGGAVIVRDDDLAAKLRFLQNAEGAVPGPFDAWLVLRGLKTLPLRMRAHTENALRVARVLAEHPAIETVFYPGLPSHPQHELARTQMAGGGGMVTARLRGGRPAVDRFLEALRVFQLAESLGGVESLVCHPATMSHASVPEAARLSRGIDNGLVRLSVGIEDPEDLVQDVVRALDGAAARPNCPGCLP
ncbi:MAG: cystathionine gamma-synthase [Deltaproteobacteria bacterium]|nr:cystathionine gamma-synthase [Deltaproteobacteria bacterium]